MDIMNRCAENLQANASTKCRHGNRQRGHDSGVLLCRQRQRRQQRRRQRQVSVCGGGGDDNHNHGDVAAFKVRAKPVDPSRGQRYPALEHCSRCGLCDTYYVAKVNEACAFIGDGMSRVEQMEAAVHGRARRRNSDESRLGVNASRTFYARCKQPVSGSQWTGVVTSIASKMLEKGVVDAVVLTGSAPDDPLQPVGVIARTVQEVINCRGVKPVIAPTLAVLEELEKLVRNASSEKSVRRVLYVGVGCQVQALRAVEKHLGLEKLYVLGTNCVDNGSSRQGLQTFLEKSLPNVHKNVSHYEFMADFNVHFEMKPTAANGYQQETIKVPYFCLPASELTDVIANSCYSCFDYANSLADVVVGYMSVPYQGGSMRSHYQNVTIRNPRGEEMWSCVEDMMDVTGAVSSGDFVRSALAKQTMIQDDDARFENKRIKEEKIDAEVKRMPLSVGKLLANVMTAIGPKGVSFAKYSVDYHTLRNYVYVHRNFKSKQTKRCSSYSILCKTNRGRVQWGWLD